MMSLLACQRGSPSGSGTRGGQRAIALRFIAISISMYSLVVVMLTCPSQDLITAIADVAREVGISETSLGNWVRAYRKAHAEDEPRTSRRCRYPSGPGCVSSSGR